MLSKRAKFASTAWGEGGDDITLLRVRLPGELGVFLLDYGLELLSFFILFNAV